MTRRPTMPTRFTPPHVASSSAVVYAGRYFGRIHRILHVDGNRVTLLHDPSGYSLTAHACDVERIGQARASATPEAAR